jgi:DNA-binding NarL/FixJ family response regulator
MSKIKILIADDHEMVRQGVRHTLLANPDWEVSGEAANGQDAVELSRREQPDIAIIDLSMPGLSGLEAIRQMVMVSPRTRILVLSMHDSEKLIHDVLAAGAQAYLLKSEAAGQLLVAVKALIEGRPYISGGVSQALLDGFLHTNTPKRPEDRQRLTPREQEIVCLIADGKANKEVAARLQISVRTVETHRGNIMEKLKLHSVSDLILYAIRTGLKSAGPTGGSGLTPLS